MLTGIREAYEVDETSPKPTFPPHYTSKHLKTTSWGLVLPFGESDKMVCQVGSTEKENWNNRLMDPSNYRRLHDIPIQPIAWYLAHNGPFRPSGGQVAL